MRLERPIEHVLEDLEFLDEHLVGATEAAERAGFASAEGMEKWLDRHGMTPLWQRFRARDPAGTHDSEARKRRRMTVVPPPPPPEEPEEDSYEDVLARAEQSTRAKTRAKAEKAKTLLGELWTTVEAETKEDERLNEIDRLEAQLRELRSAVPALTSDAPAIRAWARENQVECPERGRIPAEVRQAYEMANTPEGDPK